MIFEAPLLHGSGLGTGTSSKQAEPISPDKKAMLWSSQQFSTLTTHETSRNNNIQLSKLCLCTYSICPYYYYNYDDIQIQSACIMIV